MNRLLLAGLALIFVGVGMILYAHLGRPATNPESPSGTVAAAQAPILLGQYQETGASYTISANYPTTTPFEGSANNAALEAIQGWVIESVSAFKARTGSTTPASLAITYTASSSPKQIFYLFTTEEAVGGLASMTTRAFAFDRATGEAVAHP